jgi:hypothetical protein
MSVRPKKITSPCYRHSRWKDGEGDEEVCEFEKPYLRAVAMVSEMHTGFLKNNFKIF